MKINDFPISTRSSFTDLAPPGFCLRAARANDTAFLRRLYRALRAKELDQTDWSAAQKQAFCDDQFQLQHNDWVQRYARAWFLLVLAGGSPVGRLYLDPPGSGFHVVDIGLMPQWRNKGAGAALLQSVQAMARGQGVPVTLSVLPDNPHAIRFYHRLGFVDGETTSRHIQMIWGA